MIDDYSRKTISILGCGWLGLPLANQLVQANYSVKGSTTKVEKLEILSNNLIAPYLINYNPDSVTDVDLEFYNSEILIIDIPPRLRVMNGSHHIAQIKNILRDVATSTIQKIIFISSTSVYPDTNGIVDEDSIQNIEQAENKTLFEAEQLIQNFKQCKSLILRCGGLTGADRALVKHFAGKQDLKGGNNPVNLIHRIDLVNIIKTLIEKDIAGETINICAPNHPTRQNLYTKMAKDLNYEIPLFNATDNSTYKIISTEKLKLIIDYQFKYPDPLYFEYEVNN